MAEPLRLLTEVGARDTTDGHAVQLFANLPESLDLTLAVAGLVAPRTLGGEEPATGGDAEGAKGRLPCHPATLPSL